MRFTNSHLRLISISPATNMVIWTQVQMTSIFRDLVLRSNEKTQGAGEDVIVMRVMVDHLRKALEHCADNQVPKVSLRKSIDEMRMANLDFCFWEHTSRLEKKGIINQRVIVSLVSYQDALAMSSPSQTEDVFLEIPQGEWELVFKIIRRLRSIADTITITASHTGELELSVDTDHAQVTSSWDNMRVVVPCGDDAEARNDTGSSQFSASQDDSSQATQKVSVTVRSREWESAFQPHKSYASMILGIANDSYVTLISRLGRNDERALTYIYGISP